MSRELCALALPNGKAYLFRGTKYARFAFETGQVEQANLSITDQWPGLRAGAPDAGIYFGFDKAYFFYGPEYVRYELGRNGPEGVEALYLPPNAPTATGLFWPGLWPDRVDAAVNWGNGKLYFFRGPEYISYDVAQDRADPGYPKRIADHWNGLWADGVDAALYQGGDKAYFFKGTEFRRFDVASDRVDGSGDINALLLDPVPAAMLKAARDLTLTEANTVMGYLIQAGKFALSAGSTPYVGDWQSGIKSPQPQTHVVVAPASIDGIAIISDVGSPPQLIDNLDQRMLVALYRLARWANSTPADVSAILHKGIGHGAGAPDDCHNQGRAIDFSGLRGSNAGTPFDKRVQEDWGNRPVIPGVASRLDAAVDPLAHSLFRIVHRFGTMECECNGIGAANRFPPKSIGDQGGFVIHPDYVDAHGDHLRHQHQNHVHMQIGPTRP